MCSPVGHSIAALAVGSTVARDRLTWQFALFCIVSGNAPDLDVIIGWIAGDINGYHHLGSHSIFVAFLYGLIVCVITGLLRLDSAIRKQYTIAGALAWVAHVVLDMFSADHSEPVGMQLFWPFSQEFFAFNVSIFPAFHHDTVGGDMAGLVLGLFSMENAITVLQELAILGPLLILALWLCRQTLFPGGIISRKTGPGPNP